MSGIGRFMQAESSGCQGWEWGHGNWNNCLWVWGFFWGWWQCFGIRCWWLHNVVNRMKTIAHFYMMSFLIHELDLFLKLIHFLVYFNGISTENVLWTETCTLSVLESVIRFVFKIVVPNFFRKWNRTHFLEAII